MAAIETEKLTKRYSDHTAVQDLDFEVRSGEVYGFLGPNGAGKSTTIAMLMDYVYPTDGRARVLGMDAHEDSVEIKRRTGVLPEDCQLYDRLSGRKHLQFAIDSTDADDDPDDLIDRVGLSETWADRPVGRYSTGMKQRLHIALALVNDPELLILDEPSSGLDPSGIQLLRDIVLEERDAGTAVFFSSHILEQVEAVCDRVGILVDGQLQVSDDIQNLKSETGPAVYLHVEVDGLPSGLEAKLESNSAVTEVVSPSGDGGDGQRIEISLDSESAKAEILRTIEEHTTIRDFTAQETSLETLFDRVVEEAGR